MNIFIVTLIILGLFVIYGLFASFMIDIINDLLEPEGWTWWYLLAIIPIVNIICSMAFFL